MMLLMPFVFRYVTVRKIFVAGLICWVVRYLLLAQGNAGSHVWMFYISILLHGTSYDFFFMTGQLYTDQEAPAHLRNTAQGFITFATYGIGMLLGSLLSGRALDYFTYSENGHAVREWHSFWLSSSIMSAAILLVVFLFFQSQSKIQPKEKAVEALGV
jgi:MFS family permease